MAWMTLQTSTSLTDVRTFWMLWDWADTEAPSKGDARRHSGEMERRAQWHSVKEKEGCEVQSSWRTPSSQTGGLPPPPIRAIPFFVRLVQNSEVKEHVQEGCCNQRKETTLNCSSRATVQQQSGQSHHEDNTKNK